MKLVFAHDHKLRYIDGKYYTTGGLSDSITGRYMQYFDHLTIFCRAIKKQPYDTGLFEIKNPDITVKPVSDGSLLLSSEAKKTMRDEIKAADALIVKLHSKIAEEAIKCAREYNIPYLVELVACPWDSYWNHGLKGKFVAPMMTISTKREVLRAPYVVYVTKEFLEKRYPTDGKWIDCSDVELQETDGSILEKRLEKIKNSAEPLVLGTLAQVDVLYKGQEYVIKAIAQLRKEGKEYRYKMAGSGSPERLKKCAEACGVSDLVEFCGVLNHDDVFSWLDDIDFYIQPSKQEGLPRAMAEAVSRACPAAGSTAGGIGELIDKKFVFKKGSAEGIVKILRSLNKETMSLQAAANYELSKNYEKKYLDEKRNAFYKEFADECDWRNKN